jgi:DNA-directed RNA polymerase subunit RPC12/RpoP
METSYLCPDCGAEHADQADATLGHRIRCLDCQVEVDLAFEIRLMVLEPLAA